MNPHTHHTAPLHVPLDQVGWGSRSIHSSRFGFTLVLVPADTLPDSCFRYSWLSHAAGLFYLPGRVCFLE